AEVVLVQARNGRIELKQLLALLAGREVQSLLVEGGAAIHGAFIAAGLVDRVAFFFAPMLLGGGLAIAAATPIAGTGRAVANALALGPLDIRRLGDDLLVQADVRRKVQATRGSSRPKRRAA
ncbi:MAG: dihydrofolate reductase family protein, partial [Deltaproteobacteria bacterium]|nr:dihydrofolate reductase family protein [Deltaproteobacteria bacterium]